MRGASFDIGEAGWPALVVLLLVAPLAHARPGPDDPFERLATEHGLSHAAVTSIVQDRQGFLWFGTQDGLNRYDGYAFTVFRNDPADSTSLSDYFVSALALGSDGALWVGTAKGGLSRFDPRANRFTRYRHDPLDSASLSHDHVLAVHVTRDGAVWAGTQEGLSRLDPSARCFTRYRSRPGDPDGLSHDEVHAIHEDREGMLWVGTKEGLNRLDPASGIVTRFLHDPADPYSLSHDEVQAIHEDHAGRLWIGTFGGGLNRLDRATGRFTRYRHDPADPHSLSHDEVQAIHEDRAGRLWIGTFGGLNRFDPETGRVERHLFEANGAGSLPSNFVYAIHQDHASILWVGTLNGLGRRRTDPLFQTLTSRSDGAGPLAHPMVMQVMKDRAQALWIGTVGEGLARLDAAGAVMHFRHHPGDPSTLGNNRVSALLEDRSGVLWVGTFGGGLNRLYRATGRFTRYRHDPDDTASLSDDDVNDVYEDRAGSLWISTHGGGLNRLDRATGRFTRYRHDPADSTSLSFDAAWPIYEDHIGALWIGTSGGGLNRLDRATGRFTRYRHDPADSTSLGGDVVLALVEDAHGALWVGTRGGGLNRFDQRTGRFTRYTVSHGLPHHTVAGIQPDDAGFLWISTENGLARFDPQQEVFTTFYAEDGLPSNIFLYGAHSKGADGTLYFGTTGGLVFFHPDSLTLSLRPPPVVLTSFLLFNEPAPLDASLTARSEITLPYDHNFVAFEFAALDFTAPARNQYVYQLEGLDEAWIQAGTRRHVDYPNLAPGRYTFRVMGANSRGIWNYEGASLQLIITPPFWQTWWFRLLMASLAVGMLIVAYRYRVSQLLRVERTRQRIADDLHDDIGSKISNVALRLDLAGHNALLRDGEREQLGELARTARSVVDDLRDAVWIVDAGHDHLPGLVARMEQTADQMLRGRSYTFHRPDGLPPVAMGMEQRRHLYLFFKEALHNAVRHSQADHLEVQIRYERGMLDLYVADDGVGFALADDHQGRGLHTLRTRAEALGGRLHLESVPGHGTTVRLMTEIV